MKDTRVNARIEGEVKQKIKQTIQEGKFETESQLIRKALAEFLKTA